MKVDKKKLMDAVRLALQRTKKEDVMKKAREKAIEKVMRRA